MFSDNKYFKIRSLDPPTKYGVAAKDLNGLLKKSCKLLQVPQSGAKLCKYKDGTVLTEEYFFSFSNNTELVLLSQVDFDIGQLLNSGQHSDHLINSARDLLHNANSPKTRKLLSDMLRNLDDKSEKESLEDDPDWFKGVKPPFKTKSDYMKFNCKRRISNYMTEVNEAIRSGAIADVKGKRLKASLKQMLDKDDYNGCYFDRTGNKSKRLCTQMGWFTCQGSYDENACPSTHSINPYSNRESRIMFSTWNLDHQIEKKRVVIPTLLKALRSHNSGNINLEYFYQLLFTTQNLKLVHIVCHKKEEHGLLCDNNEIYTASHKSKLGPSARKRSRLEQ